MRRKIDTVELLMEVRNDLIEARHHFEVYRTYMHKRTLDKYGELFLVFRDFLNCDRRAHFAAMVVGLGRVFDANPRNISIAAVLRAAPDLEKVEKEKLARVEKLWKDKALHLRHEVVAHRPGSTTIEDSFKRANISSSDIGRLIGLCRQLIDAWARKLNCFSHNQSSVKPDLNAIMDTLLRTRIERHAQERVQMERALQSKLNKGAR
jgi:hypothetical protein